MDKVSLTSEVSTNSGQAHFPRLNAFFTEDVRRREK